MLCSSKRGSSFCSSARLIYKAKTPLISCQPVTNKAFKRGSSFCSSSRSYLQNEDPIDFASFGVWGKALTCFDCLWFDRLLKQLAFVYGSSFCRHHHHASWPTFSKNPRKMNTKYTENNEKRQRFTQLFYPWWTWPLHCRLLSPIIVLFWLFFVVRKMNGSRTGHFRLFNRHLRLKVTGDYLHIKYTTQKVHKISPPSSCLFLSTCTGHPNRVLSPFSTSRERTLGTRLGSLESSVE